MLSWKKKANDAAMDRIKREIRLSHSRGYVDHWALADCSLYLWMYSSREAPQSAILDDPKIRSALSHGLARAIWVQWPPGVEPQQYSLAGEQIERAFFLSVLLEDSRAIAVSLGLINGLVVSTSEPDLLGVLKACLALAGNDLPLAEEARQLVTSRTEDMLEVPVIYTLAIHAVLTRSGVDGAFRALQDHYEKRRGHPEGYAGFSEGGAAGMYLDHVLDFRGMAIAKWAYQHGLDAQVDTKYIPRRLYTM